MNCPVCLKEIEYPEALAIQLVCNCHPKKKISFQCTFNKPYSAEDDLEHFSVYLWLYPEATDNTQFYRLSYFWKSQGNNWEINLYDKQRLLLGDGSHKHSPQEAWDLLQRYHKLLSFL